MTKKKSTRRSRAKHKGRDVRKQPASRETAVKPRLSAASPGQVAAPKPKEETGQEGRRMPHLSSDIKRTFICAAVALTVLIVLYILLR